MRPYDKRARLQARAALLQRPEPVPPPKRPPTQPHLRSPVVPSTPPSMGRVRGVCAVNPIYQQAHPFWWQEGR